MGIHTSQAPRATIVSLPSMNAASLRMLDFAENLSAEDLAASDQLRQRCGEVLGRMVLAFATDPKLGHGCCDKGTTTHEPSHKQELGDAIDAARNALKDGDYDELMRLCRVLGYLDESSGI